MTAGKKSIRALFWLPVALNALCLLIILVVGLIFLWASQQSPELDFEAPGILRFFFTCFDVIMVISPLSFIVLMILSMVNFFKGGSNKERFIPLAMTVIVQGALSALLLSVMMGGGL